MLLRLVRRCVEWNREEGCDVAGAVAGGTVHVVIIELSVKAATKVLIALSAPKDESTSAECSTATGEAIDLVTSYVSVTSRAKTLETAELCGFWGWSDMAHKGFLLLIDA
ncbi:hypothetical protein EGR_10601 [Echinococcus granulosus]|uniref:Uncharacterized protein n=1 Tax=Echinococcus granulosus TaxID=6210 RepID=W6U0H5_ECHGR|nr:hypothetical protein EGR_10601 [Echinococcus granulosus]EUB54533.1 hypothetical protein EGR_10601 [Echinococcus granulosus]